MLLRQYIESIAQQTPALMFCPRACKPITYEEVVAEFGKMKDTSKAESRFRKSNKPTDEWLLKDLAMGIAFDCARGRLEEDASVAFHRLEIAYSAWTRIAFQQAWARAFQAHHMTARQWIKPSDICLVRPLEQNIHELTRMVGVLINDFDQELIDASRAYIDAPVEIQTHRAALSTLLSKDRILREHIQWEFLHRNTNTLRQNGHLLTRNAHASHTVCAQDRKRAFCGRSMQMGQSSSSGCTTLNRRPMTVAATSMTSPFGKSIKMVLVRQASALDTVIEEEESAATAGGRCDSKNLVKRNTTYTPRTAHTTEAIAIATPV